MEKDIKNSLTSSISLDSYITDYMILQRNKKNIISGRTSSSTISLKFNDTIYYGKVKNKRFKIFLPKMEASFDNTIVIYTNNSSIIINHVSIGEVILLSGQSNAKWTLTHCNDTFKDEILSANDDYLRLLDIKKNEKKKASKKIVSDGWFCANSNKIASFSELGYFLGKRLRKELNIPIGIICSAVGGTLACYWMSKKSYKDLSKRVKIKEYFDKNESTPCLGFNGMIAPLKNISFRCVAFYQGESNATNCNYKEELSAIIAGWRDYFNYQIPFIIVELPRYKEIDYSSVREAQQIVCQEKNKCYLAINIDNGDPYNIHPTNKEILVDRIFKTFNGYLLGFKKPIYPTIRKIKKISNYTYRIEFSANGGNIIFKNGMNGFECKVSNGTGFQQFDAFVIDNNASN